MATITLVVEVICLFGLYAGDEEFFFGLLLLTNIIAGLWFVFDYMMLRKLKIYLYCIGLSLGVIVKFYFGNSDFTLSEVAATTPLTVLLFQKPLRHLFLTLFKMEPDTTLPL
ncbi:MAG TPA: hypothetical protein VFE50_22095 [Cyclobacteriaceae bacterium]|nr:hypothetical protein [Cyclobacteriaceae bacterium]